MVEQPTHLTVVQGEGGASDHLPTVGNTPSTAAFPPLDIVQEVSSQEALEAFEARMNLHKLNRLQHDHSTRLFEAEHSLEQLKLQQAFELILFEASIKGVPYRRLQEAHSEAAEVLEAINEKVG